MLYLKLSVIGNAIVFMHRMATNISVESKAITAKLIHEIDSPNMLLATTL